MKNEKIRQVIKDDILSQSQGTHYETGVAFKTIQKEAKQLTASQVRNPEGTTKDRLRCKYWHPDGCQRYGHKTSQSVDCAMHKASKVERDAVITKIMEEYIEAQLWKRSDEGTYNTNLAEY